MVTLPSGKKTGKSRYLQVLGAVVVLALAWYFLFVRSGYAPEPGVGSGSSREVFVPNIDFSVFESGKIEEFKSWSVIPLEPGATGRTNPFSR